MPAIELEEPYVEEPKPLKQFNYAWVQQLILRMPTPTGDSSGTVEIVPMNDQYELPDPIPGATQYSFSDIQGLRQHVPEFNTAYLAVVAAIPPLLAYLKSLETPPQ